MNIMHSSGCFVAYKLAPRVHLPPLVSTCCHPAKTHLPSTNSVEFSLVSAVSSRSRGSSTGAAIQGTTVSATQFEDFVEKDWSFLDDDDDTDAEGEHLRKIDRIISAGNIKETSNVLVSVGSEAFVDRLVSSWPCEQVLVVHESLFILACIKEKYDKVKCWQGELINVPDKWAPLDVVYLYCLPALPFDLDQLLSTLSKKCLPGATVVMSHTRGRQVAEEQRQQYPDVVVSDLPDKITLQSTAVRHAFRVVEFEDEPARLYLVVLSKDQ